MTRSPLINRNVSGLPDNGRTSMRLDPLHWWFLSYLGKREEVVMLAMKTYPGYPRTAAVRAYLLRVALAQPPITPPDHWEGLKL